MSLRGRHVIDRIKHLVSHRFRLPVPPYGSPSYWELSYKSFGPNDCYEWGNITFENLKEFQYELIPWWEQYTELSKRSTDPTNRDAYSWPFVTNPMNKNKNNDNDSITNEMVTTTTLGETIGVHPIIKSTSLQRQDDHNFHETATFDEDKGNYIKDVTSLEEQDDKTKDQIKSPILMLGCGNSRFGEDMIVNGHWNGPILQVDVSSTMIRVMSERCSKFVQDEQMMFIEDDATELTAFRNDMIHACLDKGLLDALYCADEYEQCKSILQTVHRVLKPGGIFCFLSYTRPEFWLPKVFLQPLSSSFQSNRKERRLSSKKHRYPSFPRQENEAELWQELQVRQLKTIFLYRLEKRK